MNNYQQEVFVYCTGEVSRGVPGFQVSVNDVVPESWVKVARCYVDCGDLERIKDIASDIQSSKIKTIERLKLENGTLKDERDMLAAQLAAIQSEEDEGVDHVNG